MTIAGLLAMQGMAQAAPSAAPDIVSHPADPNTTDPTTTITYTVGAGETSTVSPLRFYCRVYNPATPPADAASNWVACGTSATSPATRTYTLDNGNWKFEVAARETTSIDTQGPVSTYSWTQNVAGPTEPPVIVEVPNDPNTTNKTSTFKVSPNPAETVSVTAFRCRTDNGTGGWGPWYQCGSPPTGTLSLNLPNGSHRLQAVTVSGAIQGTGVLNYSWNQALPAPTAPPVIQTQPTSPVTTAVANVFKSVIDPADTNLATGLQCRIDDAAWASCTSGSNYNTYPSNGDHTFSVRAIGPGGEGPVASATWTVDVPLSLNGAIDIDDVASVRLDGASLNSSIGSPLPGSRASLSAGDVNGDGRNDLAIADGADGTMHILFGSSDLSSGTMSAVGPDKGFRIVNPSGDNDLPGVIGIGDQNKDGREDLLVGPSGSGDPLDAAYVVYGVADGSSFPVCGSGAGRCLDPSTMTADQGYKISNDVADIISMTSSDFDGDGIQDLAFMSNDDTNTSGVVLKGGERTGTVDLQNAVGTDAIKIIGPSGTQFGAMSNGIDDINGDGKDEISILGGLFAGSGDYVVTGRSLEGVSEPIDLNTVEPEDGFYIALAPLGFATVANLGDMNGDGRDDLGVSYINIASLTGGEVSVVYMPELPTSDPILTGIDMEEGGGYVFNPGGASATLGLFALTSMGDVYGNGRSAMMVGAQATPVNGFDQSGALYLLKGQDPGVESPIGLGPQFTSDLGVAIVSGKARQGTFGNLPTILGDIDGDGLTDYAVSAPAEANNGLAKSGSVYIISGKNLFARAATGNSTVVNDTKATTNGQVGTNGRATDYHFEYGTSEDYGSSTESQSLAAGGTEPVSADLSGLTPDTEYHYRLVVTNELGFVQKGQDKTFKTAKTAPKEGCEADSTLPGCPDYNYCKANPTKAECQAPVAKLSGLIVSVDQPKVKRGKKTTARATIVNTGTAAAAGAKVCLSAPKKMIAGAKCVNVGSLGAGVSKTVKFKVKVKKKAKKGKKVTLKFKASANGLGSKTGKVKIKVG